MESEEGQGSAPDALRHVLFAEGTDARLVGGFTQIPNCILRSPRLSAGAKVLYGVLLSYAWQDGQCHPTQETLAATMGCQERHVRSVLAQLVQADLIRVVQQGLQQPNVYEILPVPADRPGTPPENPDGTPLPPDRQYIAGPERRPDGGQTAAPARPLLTGPTVPVRTGSPVPVRTGPTEPPTNTQSGKTHSGKTQLTTATAAEPAEPPEHGREDPPASADGGGEAPGAAAAAPPPVAVLCPDRTETPQPEPAGIPARAVGGEDLAAVCLRYTDLTGRVDLTPEQVREAAGEATTDPGYLERTLDWLRRRVAEGTVHSPRGLFLHALRHRRADQTPPPDGPGSGGGRPAEGPRDPAPASPSPVAGGPASGTPDLLARLVAAGVREPVAADLARWDAAECERQLRWLPYRGAQNPGATLPRATRERWGAPAPASAGELAPGERCPAPEERRAEQEREQTRRLFAEMDEAERAAREPGAEARGRAAIAEIWAMLERKNGGAAGARQRVGPAAPASPSPPLGAVRLRAAGRGVERPETAHATETTGRPAATATVGPEPAGDGEGGGRLRALPLSGLLETAAALRPGGPAAPAGGGERQRWAEGRERSRAPSPEAWRRKGAAAQASAGARDAAPRTVVGRERDGPGWPLLRGCG